MSRGPLERLWRREYRSTMAALGFEAATPDDGRDDALPAAHGRVRVCVCGAHVYETGPVDGVCPGCGR